MKLYNKYNQVFQTCLEKIITSFHKEIIYKKIEHSVKPASPVDVAECGTAAAQKRVDLISIDKAPVVNQHRSGKSKSALKYMGVLESKPALLEEQSRKPMSGIEMELMMKSLIDGTSCFKKGFDKSKVVTCKDFEACRAWKKLVGELKDPDNVEDKIYSLTMYPLLFLDKIKSMENATGHAYMSNKTMCDQIGCSESTGRRAIKTLIELGIIDHYSGNLRGYHKTNFYRTCEFLNRKKNISLLSRVLPSFLYLSLTSTYLLSVASETQLNSISLKDYKDLKKSSLRNSIVMSSSVTQDNTFLQKKGKRVKNLTPYESISTEDLSFFRQDLFEDVPRVEKTLLSSSLVTTFGCKDLVELSSDADSDTIQLMESTSEDSDTGKQVAHDLAAMTAQEYRELQECNEQPLLFENKYNQKKTPQKGTVKAVPFVSSRSIASQQSEPDFFGQGADEPVLLQYFDMEAHLRTPNGKFVRDMIGNVHKQRFDTWLKESGVTYEQAFDLYIQFKATKK